MFTGMIEEVGSVIAVRAGDRGTQLQIAAPHIAKEIRSGDSIAVNGCCLTLSSQHNDLLTFDLLEETIARTNLRTLRRDAQVNLERALSAGGRFGGLQSRKSFRKASWCGSSHTRNATRISIVPRSAIY